MERILGLYPQENKEGSSLDPVPRGRPSKSEQSISAAPTDQEAQKQQGPSGRQGTKHTASPAIMREAAKLSSSLGTGSKGQATSQLKKLWGLGKAEGRGRGRTEGSITHRTSPTICPASPCRLLLSSSTSRRRATRLLSTKSRRSSTSSCPSRGRLGSTAPSPASPGTARKGLTEGMTADTDAHGIE